MKFSRIQIIFSGFMECSNVIMFASKYTVECRSFSGAAPSSWETRNQKPEHLPPRSKTIWIRCKTAKQNTLLSHSFDVVDSDWARYSHHELGNLSGSSNVDNTFVEHTRFLERPQVTGFRNQATHQAIENHQWPTAESSPHHGHHVLSGSKHALS